MIDAARKACLALVFASLPALALAQAGHPQRVAFKAGRTTVSGSIRGDRYVDYVFAAGAGESIAARLTTSNDGAYFNLMAPGESEAAFFIGSTSGNSYAGAAPTSGDYRARVYLMRSAARRGERASYRLTLTLGRTQATHESGPDYADGLTGGPDYWEVTGVGANDALSLRKEPSPRATLLVQFANGTVLRNLGCRNTRGQRWCRVERPDGPAPRGWVNGRYLRESGGPM